jgi:uncharacterized protein
MKAALMKSKGVPVLWVGLPVVRGPKATADALFLDSLYRDVGTDSSGIIRAGHGGLGSRASP